ncbi:type II toxin-antitoxin system HicB family antitoxin [Candidatus Uhrbacteria bacterium]|nr:type II toxin-antitoxin system HicB family antitoxin [Candidatus Uhrbacteria bacterium]
MKIARVQHYKVLIEKGEDGFYIGRVPTLPGCVTQAKTHELLIERIKEAIQLCLEVARGDRHYRRKRELMAYKPSFIGIEEVAVRV